MTLWRFIATFFYLGKLPFAPGTWGSLGALLIWWFLPLSIFTQLGIIIILISIGIAAGGKTAEFLNKEDPSEVVIDEAAGMGIALFMLPHHLELYLIAFFLFRILDIFKPSFIHQSQNLPGGWGIMMDDVLAGLFTLAMITGISSLA